MFADSKLGYDKLAKTGVTEMRVFNTTTKSINDLTITVNNVDCTADIMQITTNNDFSYNDSNELYQADNDTIAWWQSKLGEYQEMYELIDELKPSHADQVQAILDDAVGYDFNDYPSYVTAELKAI